MKHEEPTVSTWNKVWNTRKDLDKVYPSSPAVLNSLLHLLSGNLQLYRSESQSQTGCIGLLNGLKILEVGAGTGRDSAALAKLGAEVFILDYSDESLEICAELAKNTPNLHLVQGDAFNTPFPDESFDVVFHQGLAEHFRDPLPLIKENARILKTGGFVLCDVPQTFHPYTIIKHILIAIGKWFAGWETEFTPSQLNKLIRRAGLEVIYEYGSWMKPNLFYRIFRQIGFKVGLNLPKYPLQGTIYQRLKDRVLNFISRYRISRYTQVCIGAVGKK
ncbi:hypothetical protein AGMMS49938_15360 [Fibrobacterales bacterium]|nr:hypothetical protein AGMMS49938_15360 [Fibrobacterales bacterium]